MVRTTRIRTLLPIFFCAYVVIVFTDTELRKMERFEELVAKGQGINSPLADFIHRKYGATLAVKQAREDLEFEIEPKRRLQLWHELKEANRALNNTDGVIEACQQWIAEYPNDPKTLHAYEELLIQLGKQNDTERVKKYLGDWGNSLIDMGPETKLSDILKWWEFVHLYPRLVDDGPLLEKVYREYPKHVPSLGALKSLQALYRQQGKLQEAKDMGPLLSALSARASPLQMNQSEQLVIQYLVNQRMWPQLEERLMYVFDAFHNSINFDGHLKRIEEESAKTMGYEKQAAFYRRTMERALSQVPPARRANNVPLANWIGSYGMLLWSHENWPELRRVSETLRTVGPTTPRAHQIERLLWLQDPTFEIHLPHAELTPVAVPPQVDGSATDMCWFGNDHFLGELKPAEGLPDLQTEAWATYDRSFLYLMVKSRDPDALGLFGQGARSGASKPESIEVYFNVNKDYSTYRQVASTTDGSTTTSEFLFVDEYVRSAHLSPNSWDANVIVRSSPAGDSWVCEMKIPWSELGIKAEPGASFFFGIRRIRHARGPQDIYSWSPSETTGHNVESFGVIRLK